MQTKIILSLLLLTQTAFAGNTIMKLNFFSDTSETKFWNYFQSNVDNSESLVHSKELLIRTNGKLNEYFPGLGLGSLITFVDGKKITQTYITAYGDKSKFPVIEKLVKKAPKTPKFNIIAFAPASRLLDTLTFNGKSIPSDQIEFNFKKNNQELDLSIYFRIKPAKSDNEFDYAFQSLLLEFLGEVQFAKLGLISILSADSKQTGQQTEKLEKLNAILTTVLK